MIFEQKEITLKNGVAAILKTPDVSDAQAMLDYIIKACGETDFLLRYPEEWDGMTLEAEEAWVERLRTSENTLAIACLVDGRVIGNCELGFRGEIKTCHRATVAIAILREYWGLGIGSAMFREMIAAAKKRGVEIMELEFIEGNDRAKGLYEKFGFKVMSVRPDIIKLKDGTCLSEFYMQKHI